MDAKRQAVIVIPRAAEARPAEVLRRLAAVIPGAEGQYLASEAVLRHRRLPCLLSDHPGLPDLIAVPGAMGGNDAPGMSGALGRLLELLRGLPTVRLAAGGAEPAVHLRQVFADLAEAAFLWTLWPVFLTLLHSLVRPVSGTLALGLELALLAGLGVLVRRAGPTRTAGRVWLGLCLALVVVLWRQGGWVAPATILSLRVHGFGLLLTLAVLVGMAAEILWRVAWRRVAWRQGLAAFALAWLPVGLAAAASSAAWALLLNGILACGSQPVLDGLKAWQATFLKMVGYPVAAAEWLMGAGTALVGLLCLGAALHVVLTRRSRVARGWLLGILAATAVLAILGSLGVLLSSPYLRAPLAKQAQRLPGAAADVVAIYTWSSFWRGLPWLILLLSPARRVLADLVALGRGLIPAGPGFTAPRTVVQEALAETLSFLDGQSLYGSHHVLAEGEAAATAIEILAGSPATRPMVLTTLGLPGHLLCDWLGRSLERPSAAGVPWLNLFHPADPLAGPLGRRVDGDAVLPDGSPVSPWDSPAVGARVLQVAEGSVARHEA